MLAYMTNTATTVALIDLGMLVPGSFASSAMFETVSIPV